MKKDATLLQAITDTCPYGYSVVEKVFDAVKSYDKTISVLNLAALQNVNPINLSETGVAVALQEESY